MPPLKEEFIHSPMHLPYRLPSKHITVNSISPGWIQTQEYELLRPEDHTQHPSAGGKTGRYCPDVPVPLPGRKMISSMVKNINN